MLAGACLALLALVPSGRSADQIAAGAPKPSAVPVEPTVIESGTAEMVSTAKETTFTFGKGVVVTGTNMKLTCDDLVVIVVRTGDPEATIGKPEQFKSLVATGQGTYKYAPGSESTEGVPVPRKPEKRSTGLG